MAFLDGQGENHAHNLYIKLQISAFNGRIYTCEM